MKPAVIHQPMIRSTHIILLLAALNVLTLGGQDPRPQDQTAPPPLKILTRQERSQLSELKDGKARIKLSIELAEAHLANAENQTTQHEYDKAAAEAGMYWAIVDDALIFMKTIDRENNAKRDLYKRLELSLRAHGPRLSIIRRSTPAEYAVWIKQIEEVARNGRTEALNSFYGHTVIRDGSQKPPDEKEAEKKP
jgi:hypothetical protein